MASMMLSSIRRLRAHLGGGGGDALADSANNNRMLSIWLSAVSGQVEKYLDRELHIESRTEYHDVTYNRLSYPVTAPPIVSVTSVYTDSTGLWEGSESERSNHYKDAGGWSMVLDYSLDWHAPRGLRIIYTGGLAYDPVKSVFSLSSITGTWTVGKWVVGETSGAVGIVSAFSTPSLTVEGYYGEFESGESLTQYDSEAQSASTPAAGGTIDSITRQSLAEAYPDIVAAAEAQIRYMWKHTTDFENAGATKEGAEMRTVAPTLHRRWPLIRECRDMLDPYRRVL